MEKLKICYEDGDYFWTDRSEAHRIHHLLELIPQLKDWTMAGVIAKHLNVKLEPLLKTIRLIKGAAEIQRRSPEGFETIAEKPILRIKRQEYNKSNHLRGRYYLKAPIYIKSP